MFIEGNLVNFSGLITAHQCFLSREFIGQAIASAFGGLHDKKCQSLPLSCANDAVSSALGQKTLIMGIDPGLSGAIALITSGTNPSFVSVFDIPTKKIKGKNRTDLAALSLLIESYAQDISIAIVEEVGQIGTKADPFSSFVFGFATGTVHGVLAANNVKIISVRPNVWKAALGLDSNKEKALLKAKKFFPKSATFLKRKKDHDRAEALLLAYFANNLGAR